MTQQDFQLITSFAQYVPLAIRTKSPGEMQAVMTADGNIVWKDEAAGKPVVECINSGPFVDVDHVICGWNSELGEAIGAIKSHFFYGKLFDGVNFLEELGDLWWYSAIAWDIVINHLELAPDAMNTDLFSNESLEAVIFSEEEEDEHVLNIRSGRGGLRQIRKSMEHMLADLNAFGFDIEDLEDLDQGETRESLAECLVQFIGALAVVTLQYLKWMNPNHDEEQLMNGLFMIWSKNIAKLRKRFPEKFDSDNAIGRESLAQERAILEATVNPADSSN